MLTAADVRLEEREDKGANFVYYTDVNDVIGKVPIKGIGQGQVINNHIIQYPICLRRGDRVSINANINGIVVSTEGIAMENGRKERYISVKNLNSGRVIKAKVIDDKNVEVAA